MKTKFRCIDKVILDYNKAPNRGISNLAPINVNGFMENQIIQKAKATTKLLKENYKPMLTEFRIGDCIKIRQAKSKFTDKMLSKYSNTTYIVTRIGNNSLRVI